MKSIIILAIFLATKAHAVRTYQLASKCVSVEDSTITRTIGATSGVWVRARNDCDRMGKIATNVSQYYSKEKTYFPGITMDYTCHEIKSPAKWKNVGCSGGLELGYLLEVTVEIENPNKYKWYHPKEFITYYNSEVGRNECLSDAQNFIWFASNDVKTEAECQIDGKMVKRAVKMRFVQ